MGCFWLATWGHNAALGTRCQWSEACTCMGTLVPWKRERKVKRLAGKDPFNQISPPRVFYGPPRGIARHRLTQLSFSVWHRYVLGTVNSVNTDMNSVEDSFYIMFRDF